MRWRCWIWMGLGLILGMATVTAASSRVIKVLPHWIDAQGRVALSPSLFERDAYQAKLRQEPAARHGMRFDVQWKAGSARGVDLTLRIELVTPGTSRSQPLVIEKGVRAKSGRSRWTQVLLQGQTYRDAGDVIAWRASLWNGTELLAEQRSFLW